MQAARKRDEATLKENDKAAAVTEGGLQIGVIAGKVADTILIVRGAVRLGIWGVGKLISRGAAPAAPAAASGASKLAQAGKAGTAAAELREAEVVAQESLTALQGATQGAHFLTKHSPKVSMQSLYTRATTAVIKHGKQVWDSATRFLSYVDMKQAIDKAVAAYKVGNKVGKAKITIDMGRTIGEGYYKKTGTYGIATKVVVYFNDAGEVITAFPLLP